MILVFYILGIILLISLLFFSSTLRIDVNKVNIEILKEKNIFAYELYVGLYLFNKIKVLRVKLNKEKIEKLKIKDKIKPEQINKIKQKISDSDKKELKESAKKIKIHLQSFNLKLEIDTPDVIATTGIVTIFSIFISILLSKFIKVNKKNNYKYKIIPLYTNKNILKIYFNCIINVKIVHIIFIIYIFMKKRRDGKNERTPNRRTYDYSYE